MIPGLFGIRYKDTHLVYKSTRLRLLTSGKTLIEGFAKEAAQGLFLDILKYRKGEPGYQLHYYGLGNDRASVNYLMINKLDISFDYESLSNCSNKEEYQKFLSEINDYSKLEREYNEIKNSMLVFL